MPTTMIRFITFLALVVGAGVIKAVAAEVLAGFRIDIRSVGVDAFQRRQTTVPPQCETLCDPIYAAGAVSDIINIAINSRSDFRVAHPLNVAWPISRLDISIVSSASAMQQV